MPYKQHKIADLVDVRTGFSLRTAAEEDPSGNALLVQMKDVSPLSGVNWKHVLRISTEGKRNPDWIGNNDVLFAGRGSRFFGLKVSGVENKVVASPHFYVLRVKPNAKLQPDYLVWYLNSGVADRYYKSNQEGSALPYISRKTLDVMKIRVPDIETQNKIVSVSKSWMKQKSLLEELVKQKDMYVSKSLEKLLLGEAA